MKKIILSMLLLSGCGEYFTSTTEMSTSSSENTGAAGYGGEGASGGNIGGMQFQIEKNVELQQSCETYLPYVPGQNQKDTYIVSCYQASSLEKPVNFSYRLFGGVYDKYGCYTNSHYAAWFRPTVDFNKIIDVETMNLSYIDSNELDWKIQNLNGFAGPQTTVTVVLPQETKALVKDEWFCFGSIFAFDADGKPTCPVMCLSKDNTFNFFTSANTQKPYDFFSMQQLNQNYNFVSAIHLLLKK